jgi:hypothetical protein
MTYKNHFFLSIFPVEAVSFSAGFGLGFGSSTFSADFGFSGYTIFFPYFTIFAGSCFRIISLMSMGEVSSHTKVSGL